MPEDIYKSHLEPNSKFKVSYLLKHLQQNLSHKDTVLPAVHFITKLFIEYHNELRIKCSYIVPFAGSSLGPSNVDSARQNLASSFVNGFVNSAFGQDKLLMEDGNKWIYKNKEHGELCFVEKVFE